MIVYDASGKRYSLRETSQGGGEGKLYSIDYDATHYAKIFKNEKRTMGKEAKILEWENMLNKGMVTQGFSNQVVVPQKCLYDNVYQQNVRTFVGYTMEKQKNFRDLKDVYIANDLTYIQKVWVARNICILTNRVHSFGKDIVIGDYNSNNVIIFMETSTAKFIDVDSFQLTISKNGKRILCPCTAAVPEFMAPEVMRRLKKERTNLIDVDQGPDNPVFTKYTDFYAMAYHIFALLMNGSAPYAAMANMQELAKHPSKTVSCVDIDQFHAAEKGDFVYAKRILFKKPPEYAPKYGILTPRLKKLFERAFIEGAKEPTRRPNAIEFYEALNEYIDLLEKRSCGHFISSHYSGSCEWCRLQKLNN